MISCVRVGLVMDAMDAIGCAKHMRHGSASTQTPWHPRESVPDRVLHPPPLFRAKMRGLPETRVTPVNLSAARFLREGR